jgi:hypothetical protein
MSFCPVQLLEIHGREVDQNVSIVFEEALAQNASAA